MTDYKLVPMVPTKEMILEGARHLQIMSLPEREADAVFRAMLAAAPDVQSTFTVGTDFSDGKLSVVIMKHENGITWVIHSEVIQLAEQQPVGTKLYAATPPAKLRPIEEAPKDGTVILAWCDHKADPYYCDKTGRLTAYGANAEGMAHVDDGWNLVRWEEGFFDGECQFPAWWFLADGCGETAANPVLWMTLPINPVPEDNSLVVDDKMLSPAEQKPTPDVTQLVEALELISDTDPDDGTAWFHEVANKALAAYCKQEEEK